MSMSMATSVNTGTGSQWSSILTGLGVQIPSLLILGHGEGTAEPLQVQLQLPRARGGSSAGGRLCWNPHRHHGLSSAWQTTAALGELTPGGLCQSPHVLLCVLARAVLCWQSNRAILIQQQMGLKPNSISVCRHSRATRAITFHMLTKYVSRQSFLPKSHCQKLSLYDLRDRKSARLKSAQTFRLYFTWTE